MERRAHLMRPVYASSRMRLEDSEAEPVLHARREEAQPRQRYDPRAMVFARELRERIRRGRITCSVRIWTRPHVRVGGSYPMDEGHVVVDAIERIHLKDVTAALARESGFPTVTKLLQVARHGSGRQVFL